MTILIAVINESTLVANEDVRKMTGAVQKQISWHLCPAWNLKNINVWFYADKTTVPANAYVVSVLDNYTQAGVLGYHDEDATGRPEGFVFAQPVLSNGGVVLHDPNNNQNVSVASVASHEICELIVDANAATWVWGPTIQQGNEFALEACDAVEGYSYDITLSNGITLVSVSDFLLPEYFNQTSSAKAGAFDFLGKLSAPFSLGTSAYMIVSQAGQPTQVFSEAMPEWKREMKKNELSRMSSRSQLKGH